MGNICRSPSAEGVFAQLVEREGCAAWIEIDSAGTHGYHVGEQADPRSLKAALSRGVDISAHRARQVSKQDFEGYDYILAMDQDNHDLLMSRCPVEYREKVQLFLEFAPHLPTREVPDPYYGGHKGFEHVLDLVEAASIGLLEAIRQRVAQASNA
jgi:protein-tyrosine phosphatase